MSEPSDQPATYALIVDDGLIRMDAMDLLEEAGFRTFEASDGNKPMVLLAERHAVIVLPLPHREPTLRRARSKVPQTSSCVCLSARETSVGGP
ncbi:hypothetical protein [Methylobacterium nigriterrae]|uniref:hypothetical protein n=1 Tax=Methylobacterium nigriterrae TaxID=3127512 RepID=UPI00301369FE